MKIQKILSSLFLCFPAVLWAAGSDQLNAFLKEAQSASGSFSQKVVDKNNKLVEDSQGDFRFSRPGNFIWVYTSPYYQEMTSNGKTLWVWDKDMNQVTVRTLKGALPSSPASVLFGTTDLNKDWNIENLPDSDGAEWVRLTPKAKDGNFEEVKIGLRDGKPVFLQFKGNLGETSSLEFKNIETGVKISKKDFQFQIPKGADVLKVD